MDRIKIPALGVYNLVSAKFRQTFVTLKLSYSIGPNVIFRCQVAMARLQLIFVKIASAVHRAKRLATLC